MDPGGHWTTSCVTKQTRATGPPPTTETWKRTDFGQEIQIKMKTLQTPGEQKPPLQQRQVWHIEGRGHWLLDRLSSLFYRLASEKEPVAYIIQYSPHVFVHCDSDEDKAVLKLVETSSAFRFFHCQCRTFYSVVLVLPPPLHLSVKRKINAIWREVMKAFTSVYQQKVKDRRRMWPTLLTMTDTPAYRWMNCNWRLSSSCRNSVSTFLHVGNGNNKLNWTELLITVLLNCQIQQRSLHFAF